MVNLEDGFCVVVRICSILPRDVREINYSSFGFHVINITFYFSKQCTLAPFPPLTLWGFDAIPVQLYLANHPQNIMHRELTWDYIAPVPTQWISISGKKMILSLCRDRLAFRHHSSSPPWYRGHTGSSLDDVQAATPSHLQRYSKERLTGHRFAPLSSVSLSWLQSPLDLLSAPSLNMLLTCLSLSRINATHTPFTLNTQ